MTKKELMHQIYILAKEMGLIKNVTEGYYSRAMWSCCRKEEVEQFYIHLLEEAAK